MTSAPSPGVIPVWVSHMANRLLIEGEWHVISRVLVTKVVELDFVCHDDNMSLSATEACCFWEKSKRRVICTGCSIHYLSCT